MLQKSENIELQIDAGNSSGLTESTPVVRSKAVVAREMGGETLIIPIRGHVGDLASIYSFNHTGSLIWKLLQQPSTPGELADRVAREYGVERNEIKGDVEKFVAEMKQAGLVE